MICLDDMMDPYNRHCQGVVYRGVPCLDFALRDAPRTKRSTMLRVERSFVLIKLCTCYLEDKLLI